MPMRIGESESSRSIGTYSRADDGLATGSPEPRKHPAGEFFGPSCARYWRIVGLILRQAKSDGSDMVALSA